MSLNVKDMQQFAVTKEIREKVIDLTLALYRVTELFPKEEPLIRHTREKANEILSGVLQYGFDDDTKLKEASHIIVRVNTIKEYLEIAINMRFVKSINCYVLEREYDIIAGYFRKEMELAKKIVEKPVGDKPPKVDKLATWKEFSFKINPTENKTREIANTTVASELVHDRVNERQKAIIERLKETKEAKISDFYQSFKDISTKTIQRDLQDLVSRNFLIKEGEKRWTVYSLNRNYVL